MAEKRVTVDKMSDAIMAGLKEYADLATDTVKEAVKDSAKTVKKEIQEKAPKRTGRYRKSWTSKKTAENSNSMTVTVYSKDRYQIAHLLEHGHAKRGGGRVAGREHIAPAEEKGKQELLRKIERGLNA
nr:MAG TPA: putative tail component [Caudoviricetes sp.]